VVINGYYVCLVNALTVTDSLYCFFLVTLVLNICKLTIDFAVSTALLEMGILITTCNQPKEDAGIGESQTSYYRMAPGTSSACGSSCKTEILKFRHHLIGMKMTSLLGIQLTWHIQC
jgi:hypothetical protein